MKRHVGMSFLMIVFVAGCSSRRDDVSNKSDTERLLSIASSLKAATPSEPMDPSLIAQGKGFGISHRELDNAVYFATGTFALEGGILGSGKSMWPRQDVLQDLICNELLLMRATSDDTIRGRQKGEQRMTILIQRAGSEKELTRRLSRAYLSLDELRQRILDDAIAQAVLERELARRKAGGKRNEVTTMTPDEIKRQMKPYLDELWLDAEVRISDAQLQSILAPPPSSR